MRAPSLIALIMCALVANAVAVHFLDVWSLVDEDEIMEVVRHVSVERIVDTEPHKEVEQYIADMFSRHAPDWTFERDSFVDDTPDGKKTFVNLIATLDAVSGQTSDKYIVLAAHYDSKVINGIKFEAAVDSAVPCAILIQFARNFKAMTSSDLLTGYKGHNWGIKIIFFDGEEAFHEWTPVDSIYGSRHLAQDWAEGSQKLLEKIDAFFLFDLLGGPNMAPIPSRYTSTNNKFNYFVAAQTASQQAGRLPIKLRYFSSTPQPHVTIEDDHIPWLRRGVPIVHLIPAPFPEVWHKETDTWQNVDTTSVRHLTGIIHLAILNYLEDN